uniref:PorV/PorQ family protein n=1 Tax=candidate division WOR-3 bacterium TaxID=2052148 RepID=A0A7V3KNP1_UNCW3
MTKQFKKLLLSLAVLAGIVKADSFDAGVPFLMIFPSPRATGMAAAFSTIADDPSATYYNPAGLGFIKRGEIMVVHTPWLRGLAPDMYHEFTAFTYPLPVGTVGANIIFLYYGKIEGVSDDQYLGSWSPYDLQIQVSYGYKINDNLSVGGDIKFIHSFLAPEDVLYQATGIEGGGSGSTFAVGAGFLYRKPFTMGENKPEFRYSLFFDNFGPGLVITSTGERDPLPYHVKTGVAFIPLNIKNHKISLAFEITKVLVNITNDYRDKGIGYVLDDAWKHAGLEYTLFDLASLRFGYFHDQLGARKGITFGFGVKFKGLSIDVSDDHYIYSFKQGLNVRYGLSYAFKF